MKKEGNDMRFRNLKDRAGANPYLAFFLCAVFFLWLKTYVVQLTQFQLGVDGALQQFLLVLNALASSLLFLSMALFYRGQRKYGFLLGVYIFLSILLYANILFYRSFNDFITLPTLFQTQNFADVSGSIPSLVMPYDFLFFLDTAFLWYVLKKKRSFFGVPMISSRRAAAFFLLALGISSINIAIAEADRPQLLTRGFDRNYIVKYLGVYNYTIYDALQSTKASAQRVLANSDDMTEIVNYTKTHYAEPNEQYFGIGKGKNVIYIHLESIQTFLIDYKLHGEEVTPFLNSMAKDNHTMYFDNFFHQTAQGKTADAEFMIENSLFGLSQGSAFITKGLNTYHSAPAILGQEDYTSAVFHGNSGSFWNRDEIYKSFGYDHFYDATYYEMTEENVADYGLMDKPFFEQSIPYLESLPQPFYSKFITVSHHYPFKMDEEDASIEPNTTGNKTVDRYFQTARYADEALEQFFNDLKESGLYENSIIIMYGDHNGISKNHNKAMSEVIGKEIGPLESAGLQRVPLFITVPGMEGGVNHEYSGQIDLLPTLLHLLGIESKDYVHFGTDLLSQGHDDLVVFRNGDYVSPKYTLVEGKFYDTETGMELQEEETEEAVKLRDLARQKLDYSDKVVTADLLRFYQPQGFEPVDRSKYQYQMDEMENSEE